MYNPTAPLPKGGWQIADIRQFDWGILVFFISPRPFGAPSEAVLLATGKHLI